MDGDARGGAALSMRAVTGKPIKLIGTGEKVDALEEFHPGRVANRILGMGDIVSLVERAAETIDAEKAQRVAEKMRRGKFDLEDLRDQLAQVDKIGGMGGVLGMLPGMGKMKDQIAQAGLGDGMIKRQRAIIDSMTPAERKNPDVLKASRKKRIAAGSGTKVEEVNRLLKMHRQMADMMKSMGSGKRGGLGAALGNMLGMGGGGMPQPSPEMLAEMQRKMGGGAPGLPGGAGLPALPPGLGGSGKGPALPGLGGPKLPGGLPGLGGFPFGGGKKK
jgi:signal recognition particle subunit SRP54